MSPVHAALSAPDKHEVQLAVCGTIRGHENGRVLTHRVLWLLSVRPKFANELHLDFLYLHQTFPLMRKQVINFLVEMSNLEFRLEIHLVIVQRSHSITVLLSILTHHDDRRLNRCQAG